jgi:SAM-dependent methyltransferase
MSRAALVIYGLVLFVSRPYTLADEFPEIFAEATGDDTGMVENAPAHMRAVAIELAALGENDRFAEIGCGDGRVLVDAMLQAPESCTAVGIEIDPALALVARMRVREAGLQDRVQIACVDARLVDYSSFTVVYMYLGGFVDLTGALAPKLDGKRIVTISHPVPGMRGGEQFSHVWLYRKAEYVGQRTQQAASKPTQAQPQPPVIKCDYKPTLYVVYSSGYCPPCEKLKADIAAGKLSDFNIVQSGTLKGRSFPEVRFTNPETGLDEFVNGWPNWGFIQGLRAKYGTKAVETVASPPASRQAPFVEAGGEEPMWTWNGVPYPLLRYQPCSWSGCDMCNTWRGLMARYRQNGQL